MLGGISLSEISPTGQEISKRKKKTYKIAYFWGKESNVCAIGRSMRFIYKEKKINCHRWRSICEAQQPSCTWAALHVTEKHLSVARGGVTINVWDAINIGDSLITTVAFAAEWLIRMYIMFLFRTAEHLCRTFPTSRRRRIDSYMRRIRLEPLNAHSSRCRLGSMWGKKSSEKCLKVKVNEVHYCGF